MIAAATPAPIVSFVGASETSGFGLARGELAYPDILARRCSFVAAVDGQINKRVIFRSLTLAGSARVIFVSQFDAAPTPTVEDLARWLQPGHATIVVEAPLISDEHDDLAYYQQRFYHALEQVSSISGASVVLLRAPIPKNQYTQADGLHPNERGQKFIADALEPALRARGLCTR